MNLIKIGLTVVMTISVCLGQSDVDKQRKWTSSSGKVVVAQMIRVSGDNISLKTTKGNVVQLPLVKLSGADISSVKTWKKSNPSGFNIPGAPYKKWPTLYRGKDGFNVKYTKFDIEKKYHLYKTVYFDFFVDEKLTHSTLWNCISIFYNVAGVLNTLPLHLECIPDKSEKKYEVYLVGSKNKYRALGGPPNSGGFYDPKRNITVIPFSSMGLVKEGSNWTFDKQKRNYGTLIHELTHHLTYKRWPGQPCWLEEGLADFMGTMPCKGTQFSFAQPGRYIQQHFERIFKHTKVAQQLIPGGKYQAISLEYMFKVPRSRWNALLSRDHLNGMRQYHTSLMMLYYFAFLDGKQDGANLVKFMHVQRKAFMEKKVPHAYTDALREKYLLRGRTYKQLEGEMTKAFAKNKLKVTFR